MRFESIDAGDNLDDSSIWHKTPFYVVGQKTADTLITSAPTRPAFYPSPDYVLGAAETGSGEKLASLIIKHVSNDTDRNPAPLLYLTGDKNRDAIQTALSDANIAVHLHQVYRTSARANLAAELKDAVSKLPTETTNIWIAFFAPSSAAMALPTLSEILSLPTSTHSEERAGLPSARFAAIGKTTSSYLQEEHIPRFRVDAVASSPTAEELARAISNLPS